MARLQADASNNYALTHFTAFDYPDGANSLATLIADSAGNLYGTASQGGVSNYGIGFSSSMPRTAMR